MSRGAIPSCENCEHYLRQDEECGECHRFPPQMDDFDGVRWPIVHSGEYCGEYKEDEL